MINSKYFKLTSILLALFLALFVIASCSVEPSPAPAPAPSPAPSPTPSPAPSPTPSPAPSPQPSPAPAPETTWHLKFASWNPEQAPVGQLDTEWASLLEERTGGRVKTTVFFSETLLKNSDVFKGVRSGIADVGYYVVGTDPGVLDLNYIIRYPFLGLKSMESGTIVYQELVKKFPELKAEYSGLKTFAPSMMPPNQLHSVNRVVRVPDDMKGMKVIARGEWAEVMNAVGATPVGMGPGDWYQSLERGLTELTITHFPVMHVFKCDELTPYHSLFGEGGAGMAPALYIMNMDTWNSFPSDIQQVLEELGQYRADRIVEIDKAEVKRAMDWAIENDHTIVELTTEEVALWSEAIKPLHDKWLEPLDARGLPGRAIYEEAKRLIDQS